LHLQDATVRCKLIYFKEFNRMNLSVAVLGVDIAKLKFDVCLIKENGKAKHKVFTNTTHGFEQLVVWLNSHQAGICTFVWKQRAVTAKLSPFICLMKVIGSASPVPAAVKAFAASRLTRTKTDTRGCRTDCPFLSVATTASVAAACAAGA